MPCGSSGEITPANDIALQQFGSYAATHDEVLVDLSQSPCRLRQVSQLSAC